MRAYHRTTRLAAAAAAVLAAVVILMPPASAVAQGVPDWNNPDDPLQSAIGLHYGRIGGHGLSFRLPVRWWLYVQAAGGLWHTSDHKQHNLGLQANYILRQDQHLRLYLAAGAGWFYDDELVDEPGGETWHEESHVNWGAGVGLELLRGRRWALQLEADFMRHGQTEEIKVTPQFGLHYYW
jgi:hypothetical protein